MKYRVIVGGYADPTLDQRYASDLNKKNPDLKASVALPKNGSKYYAVVLGEYAVYTEAKGIQDLALANGLNEAWISPERK